MNNWRVIGLLCVGLMWAGLFFLYPKAESFYIKTLQDGKTYYNEGKYEQAIDYFKIAEFGLLEEKDYLAELYLYYALSCFKLGKVNESHKILNTLKTEFNIREPGNIPSPPGTENDVKLMLSTLKHVDNKSIETGDKNKNLLLVKNFEEGFQKALNRLKNNDLPGADQEIKRLKSIDKKDVRIQYLKGIAAFKKKKYGKCIGNLKRITELIDPVYRDEVFYYLSLSYYFEKKTQQADFYFQQVTEKKLREELGNILVEKDSRPSGNNIPSRGTDSSRTVIKENSRVQTNAADSNPHTKIPQPSIEKKVTPEPQVEENSFDKIFLETLKKVRENRSFDLIGIEEKLEELKKINKRDARILYLKGLMAFKEKKYPECIKLLNNAGKTIDPTFRNDIYYYLTLSYFFLKNYGQTMACYQEIDNPENLEKLSFIIGKVEDERNISIHQISRNFSAAGLNKLFKQFPGDQSLCTDILDVAVKANISAYYIMNIINQCIKKKQAYNEAFVLTAVEYLEKKEEIKSAIKLIVKSKFYKSQDPLHIEIQYKLGQLYLKNHDLKKALKQMTKVKGIQENYKKIDDIIEKINVLIYNKGK